MTTDLTHDELEFLKGLLLDAQFKAENVPPGPWKRAFPNNERKIAELWGKVHHLQQSSATPIEPDLWVSEQHGDFVVIPGDQAPDTSVYHNWRKARFTD